MLSRLIYTCVYVFNCIDFVHCLYVSEPSVNKDFIITLLQGSNPTDLGYQLKGQVISNNYGPKPCLSNPSGIFSLTSRASISGDLLVLSDYSTKMYLYTKNETVQTISHLSDLK